MSNSLNEVLALIELERIEENLFRGVNKDIGTRQVFGGQVAAQCLVAAMETVETDRYVHSLHGYFILPGDVEAPIVFEVDRTRDGRSFTTRRIKAIQHGRAIFHMAASFQLDQPGLEHQMKMPEVPQPEELPLQREILSERFEAKGYPLPKFFQFEPSFLFKHARQIDPFEAEARPPRHQVWFKPNGELPADLDLRTRQVLLTYASDFQLLGVGLLPHPIPRFSSKLRIASLDHAIWFHHPPELTDWMLYDMDTPSSSGSRVFCRGSIFSRKGKLVASTTQEGLLRYLEG